MAPLLTALVIIALLLAVPLAAVLIYNRLIALRVETDNAWADIDVQLKRRHDLVPNLVETTRGYAAHERDTLDSVTAARTAAVTAQTAPPGERAGAEGLLSAALGRLLAVAESYPQLRAAEPFQELQRSLAAVEHDLQQARRYYNAAVRELNTRVAQFPSNLVAAAVAIRPRDFFEIEAAAEREAPRVRF